MTCNNCGLKIKTTDKNYIQCSIDKDYYPTLTSMDCKTGNFEPLDKETADKDRMLIVFGD